MVKNKSEKNKDIPANIKARFRLPAISVAQDKIKKGLANQHIPAPKRFNHPKKKEVNPNEPIDSFIPVIKNIFFVSENRSKEALKIIVILIRIISFLRFILDLFKRIGNVLLFCKLR